MEQDASFSGSHLPGYLQPFDDSLSSGSTDSPQAAVGSPVPPLPPGETRPPPKIQTSQKGVENAKKRLRAFSLQMRTPASPSAGKSTSAPKVIIGKIATAKPVLLRPAPPKVFSKVPVKSSVFSKPIEPIPYEIEEQKAVNKPPKPGSLSAGESFLDHSKQTLNDIEGMKRKMELVELGIPLGLITPESNPASKAMPTKAMPPIKSFLTSEQLDEIIDEAKRARAEGKEFKFDYQKLLPNYENPFQRKKDREEEQRKERFEKFKSNDIRLDKYDSRRHKRDERDKSRPRDKERSRERRRRVRDNSREHDRKDRDKSQDKTNAKSDKETKVNLNDYVVCDSWSENDSKADSPNTEAKSQVPKKEIPKADSDDDVTIIEMDQLRENLTKTKQEIEHKILPFHRPVYEIPKPNPISIPLPKSPPPPPCTEKKFEKLKPVIDSFTYEIDDDDAMDMLEENYAKHTGQTKSQTDDQDSQEKFDINEDFLESVINEINKDDMSENDNMSPDKGLVEYDSPEKIDSNSGTPENRRSVTPELLSRSSSRRSDYSESGFKSVESYKSSESGYKSTKSLESSRSDSYRLTDAEDIDDKRHKVTENYLETWSFVMKICQPLLFRHDKNDCYKETKSAPKLWYAQNPKLCDCVKDRSVVYEELERCKMTLVDKVYGCDQITDIPSPSQRDWYPAQFLPLPRPRLSAPNDWEDSTPKKNDDETLDMEYQRFMNAVWPEVAETTKQQNVTPSREQKRKNKEELGEKKSKKMKVDDSWSQDDDVIDVTKSTKKRDKSEKRDKSSKKRKMSSSSASASSSMDNEDDSKRKKSNKKKEEKKLKIKAVKRRKMEKKHLKKLKEKQRKKSRKDKSIERTDERSGNEMDMEPEKQKKFKKKKQSKLKKERKKKTKSSTDTDSDSESSDSESSREKRSKKRKKSNELKKKKNRKKKRKHSTSDSNQSDEVFDVNILKNIKREKGIEMQDFSPRRQQYSPKQEIINMKELQINLQIKQEVIDEETVNESTPEKTEVVQTVDDSTDNKPEEKPQEEPEQNQIKTIISEDSSQNSSQDSSTSQFEKDTSHLRPSSQNSNYSFNDVMNKAVFEEANAEMTSYDMFEQNAMEYQNDVAKEGAAGAEWSRSRPIETVVSGGGVTYEWTPGATPALADRPSRWGLKPGEANIVLTGNQTESNEKTTEPETFAIECINNRTDSIGYDEAYEDMYGESDRLQYGDCFGIAAEQQLNDVRSSLDDRINQVLAEVAKEEPKIEDEKDKGILVTKVEPVKAAKRVSFADGYKPGQDSDVEEPPIKKKRRRRFGCAWPCEATHPDHVPLWDALPPPPPPPGSPTHAHTHDTHANIPPLPTNVTRMQSLPGIPPQMPQNVTRLPQNMPMPDMNMSNMIMPLGNMPPMTNMEIINMANMNIPMGSMGPMPNMAMGGMPNMGNMNMNMPNIHKFDPASLGMMPPAHDARPALLPLPPM